MTLHSRGADSARSFARTLSLEKRGSREYRVHAAPAVSCANMHKNTHTSIQVQRRQSGIPCAMVLTLISCSPRRSGFFGTVACEDLACRKPGRVDMPIARRPLRRQDHTISPSASAPFVCAPIDRSRIDKTRPAIKSCARALPRPPHPAPTFVTMANAPLAGRDGESYSLIWISEKQKYFCERGWTSGKRKAK
jgi:hypothetical protein